MPTPYPLVTIPHNEVSALTSTIVPQEYRIFVAFPEDYQTSEARYLALYALDAKRDRSKKTNLYRCVGDHAPMSRICNGWPRIYGIGITRDWN